MNQSEFTDPADTLRASRRLPLTSYAPRAWCILASVAIGMLQLATVGKARAATIYHLTNLGNFGSGYVEALGINNSGAVVGYANDASGNAQPFIYSNGVMTNIAPAGVPGGEATAISDNGQITGYTIVAGGVIEQAFLYSGGTFTTIPVPSGYNNSRGYAINNGGQVGGNVSANSGAYTASIFSNGSTQKIQNNSAAVYGINAAGEAVGNLLIPVQGTVPTAHAFTYLNGTLTDLGAQLGGPYAFGSDATGINNSGQIIGDVGTRDIDAFLYSNGVATNLGTLPGQQQSQALGLNDEGQVVGSSFSDGDNEPLPAGFLYSGGQMLNLNNMLDSSGNGWQIQQAVAINDNGWIAADATFRGNTFAVLLTPVPEPSTFLIAIAAGALIAMATVRRFSRGSRRTIIGAARGDRIDRVAVSSE
jgi:probable HAF family extracellular repeat protein